MKKLLFITPELPYPAVSGGKLKSRKLIEALAGRYDVTLACPLKLEDPQRCSEFHSVSPCDDHLHEALDVPRTPLNLMRSYLKGVPLNVLRTFSKRLQQRIATIAAHHDIVMLDHYEVFPYLPKGYPGLMVYHAHNAYFKMWQRYAELPGNPAMRAAAALEARRVRRCESAVAHRAGLVFAAPNDATELCRSGVSPDKIGNTYHLGDDSQLELPELRFEGSEKKLMYVGFLGWEPNAQGLRWFIDQVWPRLVRYHPDLRFDIVGKNPDEHLRAAVARHAGIRLLGFVEDLQTVYSSSRVSVAPLLFGSGMKVKVLDAMARGMPTVTTSIGAEGIEVEHGRHLMVADDATEMARQIDRLLLDAELWRCLQSNSRELVRSKYTWNRLFEQMHRHIDLSLRSHSAVRPVTTGKLVQHAG